MGRGVNWTIEELESILGGIKKHGVGKWIDILKDPQFASSLANRNNIALKNKWIYLGQYDESKTVKRWTDEEVEALFGAVKKHGVKNWKAVFKDSEFASSLANRSKVATADKWASLSGSRDSKTPVTESSVNQWTIEELEAFLSGIKKHGVSNWKYILNDPQLASSLANRSDTDLEDKWCSSDRSCDRTDYTMRPPPSSSKKQLVEEVGDPEHYRNPCTITHKKRTHNYRVNQRSKKSVVEDLNDSHDHLNPCTVTRHRNGKHNKMINQESEESEVEEVSDSQDESYACSPCTITHRIRGAWRNRVNQSRKLDCRKVHSYLENLWLSLSEEKKTSVTYLDPFYYDIYSRDSDEDKEKVLKWIKRKDIFSRNYVFLPVVKWSHWMVLIFCHLGASFGSTIKTPCILLLDSMAKTEHSNRLEPMIRKFVSDIYISSERTEDPEELPFLVPKVPQQRDDEECGFFALYYIKLFIENAPQRFSVSSGYPYFMKKDWFNFEGLDTFCETLDFTHL